MTCWKQGILSHKAWCGQLGVSQARLVVRCLVRALGSRSVCEVRRIIDHDGSSLRRSETFIDRKTGLPGAVRRGGIKLERVCASRVPPLRTAPEVLGPTSYKHAPPAGGENPSLITAAINRYSAFCGEVLLPYPLPGSSRSRGRGRNHDTTYTDYP